MLGERKDKEWGLKQQSPQQDLGEGDRGLRTEASLQAWFLSRLSGQQAFPQPGQDLSYNH